MQMFRSTVAVGLLAAFVAACSGTPAATQAPGGSVGGGATTPPEATIAPVETPSGGGGGGGNTGGGSGQMHIEISGPVQATVDQPFFGFGSRFGGAAGLQLNFTSEGSNAIASISGVQDTYVISYVSEELTANSQTCALTDWNIGATSGSGSFDCTDGFGAKPDGTFLSGINMKGSFEASQ